MMNIHGDKFYISLTLPSGLMDARVKPGHDTEGDARYAARELINACAASRVGKRLRRL